MFAKCRINTTNRVLEVYDSLEALVSQLNDDRFVKCHRAIIVNKDYIDYVDRKNKSLVLTNGYTCELGSKYHSKFYLKDKCDTYAI